VDAQIAAGAFGRTYSIPLPPGKLFPKIPARGLLSEKEIAALPGARLVPGVPPDFSSGPTPDAYTFSRPAPQRNLYRVPLR
jgi:hypothetical protein